MTGAARPGGERGAQRGSASVEFALVLPLLLLVALALLQVGLLLKDRLAVADAARGGAREAAVTTDDEAVRASALRAGVLAAERTEVEIIREGGAGDPVSVRVRYEATLAVPLVAWLFPDRVVMETTATMRQEVDGM